MRLVVHDLLPSDTARLRPDRVLACGTKVKISAEGKDEAAAVEALTGLLDTGCGESF